MRTALLALLIGSSGVSAPLHAASDDSLLPDNLQIHGFLSQGYVKSSDNQFFGNSEKGSFDLREIGLNASYQARPDLLFSAQLLSRTAGEMYDGSVHLDYGLMDYTAIMQPEYRAGLRLGRLKNPLGLYNDTRDVPFTRPSIFLPQSIYFDRVRNLELSADGGGLYGDYLSDYGDLFFQLNYGFFDVDKNVEMAFLNQDFPGHMQSDTPWVSARLMYEWDGGRLRLAASAAKGKLNYKPGMVDFLGPGVVDIEFWILSAQYNAEDWSLSAEFMNEPIKWRGFGPIPQLNTEGTAEGWYVQGTYHVAPGWELLLRYDASFLNQDDRDGTKFTRPPHAAFAKDWTIGARWDVTSQFMLRAEFHRVDGGSWLSGRENDRTTIERHWDMFALLASYRF